VEIVFHLTVLFAEYSVFFHKVWKALLAEYVSRGWDAHTAAKHKSESVNSVIEQKKNTVFWFDIDK